MLSNGIMTDRKNGKFQISKKKMNSRVAIQWSTGGQEPHGMAIFA